MENNKQIAINKIVREAKNFETALEFASLYKRSHSLLASREAVGDRFEMELRTTFSELKKIKNLDGHTLSVEKYKEVRKIKNSYRILCTYGIEAKDIGMEIVRFFLSMEDYETAARIAEYTDCRRLKNLTAEEFLRRGVLIIEALNLKEQKEFTENDLEKLVRVYC